jgi:hypothetical protein
MRQGVYRWDNDPGSMRRVLEAADRWCRADGSHQLVATAVGTLVARDEDVVERMLETVSRGWPARLETRMADGGFRVCGIASVHSPITLVAGEIGSRKGWHTEVDAMRSVLGEQAGELAYARIRRGWMVAETLREDRLGYDWPQRPDRPGETAQAFEDLLAPDAFAIQLLGPGYARLAPLEHWTSEPAEDAILLEHRDPSAWFTAPFVPFGVELPPGGRTPPEVLTAARAELAPILLRAGALAELGFAEVDE